MTYKLRHPHHFLRLVAAKMFSDSRPFFLTKKTLRQRLLSTKMTTKRPSLQDDFCSAQTCEDRLACGIYFVVFYNKIGAHREEISALAHSTQCVKYSLDYGIYFIAFFAYKTSKHMP